MDLEKTLNDIVSQYYDPGIFNIKVNDYDKSENALYLTFNVSKTSTKYKIDKIDSIIFLYFNNVIGDVISSQVFDNYQKLEKYANFNFNIYSFTVNMLLFVIQIFYFKIVNDDSLFYFSESDLELIKFFDIETLKKIYNYINNMVVSKFDNIEEFYNFLLYIRELFNEDKMLKMNLMKYMTVLYKINTKLAEEYPDSSFIIYYNNKLKYTKYKDYKYLEILNTDK